MTQKSNEEDDSLFNIKYIAYCQAMMPPEDEETTFQDFVIFAKRRLCDKVNKLMKDPIWKEYSDEDILVEYFSYIFLNDKESRDHFEGLMRGEDSDLTDWFNKKIAENHEELKELLGDGSDEDLSFTPDSIGND